MTRFAVALALGFAACACGEGMKPEPATRQAPAGLVWRTVGSWSGHGNGQTGSFNVETGALRIRWEARSSNAADTSPFKLWLHSAISGRPLQMVVEHKGPGSDVAYIEDEPRVSYLLVESGDLDWSVTLDEAAPGTTR
jgi:hypothetical protein